jgi:hypothetical protein
MKREGEEAKGRSSSTFQWFWQERFERALADPITDLRILLYIVQMLLEWEEWNITHERTITTRKHERERERGGREDRVLCPFQEKIKSDPIVYETTLENETNKFCPLSGLSVKDFFFLISKISLEFWHNNTTRKNLKNSISSPYH